MNNIISISDDETSDNDIEIIEFRKQTQDLLNNPKPVSASAVSSTPTVVKKLAEVQCPICFDEITQAIVTSCGHIFCLECIMQSLSASRARGQVRGGRGTGLCPLCRKSVSFKETVVLKIKLASFVDAPKLPELPTDDIKIGALEPENSDSEEVIVSPKKRVKRRISDTEEPFKEESPRKMQAVAPS